MISINEWIAHIPRAAPEDVVLLLRTLYNNQVLIIMNWAIEFPLVGYRETQRKWLWIKGRSLHVSVVVNKRADGEVEVEF